MKNLQHYIHRIIALFLLAGFLPVGALALTAENDLDRDIRVLEQILKGVLQEHGNVDINASYISGYGILLNVTTRLQMFRMGGVSEDGTIQFESNVTEAVDKYENAILTFFTDYMIRLENLPNGQHIAVFLQTNAQSSPFGALAQSTRSAGPTPPSRIFFSAPKTAFEQVSSGRINRDEFVNRMTIQKYAQEESSRDIRVLENIIKNEFAQDREKTGSISSITGTHIPGLGIWMDATLGFSGRGSLSGTLQDLNIVPAQIRGIHVNKSDRDNEEITIEIDRRIPGVDSLLNQRQVNAGVVERRAISSDSMRNRQFVLADSTLRNAARALEASVANATESLVLRYSNMGMSAEASKEAYDESIDLIKTLILDYGNILRDVDNDESIILQVRLRQIAGELPQTTQINVPKSLIDSYQSGRTSKVQAMNQITVTTR